MAQRHFRVCQGQRRIRGFGRDPPGLPLGHPAPGRELHRPHPRVHGGRGHGEGHRRSGVDVQLGDRRPPRLADADDVSLPHGLRGPRDDVRQVRGGGAVAAQQPADGVRGGGPREWHARTACGGREAQGWGRSTAKVSCCRAGAHGRAHEGPGRHQRYDPKGDARDAPALVPGHLGGFDAPGGRHRVREDPLGPAGHGVLQSCSGEVQGQRKQRRGVPGVVRAHGPHGCEEEPGEGLVDGASMPGTSLVEFRLDALA